jgi:hypothetical protein
MGQDMDDNTVAEPSRRTPLLLGGIALAGVLAGLLGYFVAVPMFSGDPAGEAYVSKGRTAAAAATPTPSPSATALKAYRGAKLHDPFKPLVVDNGAGGSSSTSGTTTSPGATTATATAAPTGTTTAAPTRVGVVDITNDGGRAVMIRLDTAIHIATEGETVADVIKVVSIRAKSATFLYGDASFTLGIGQEKVLG